MTNEWPLQMTIINIFSTKYNFNSSNVGCSLINMGYDFNQTDVGCYMQTLSNNNNPESVCLTLLETLTQINHIIDMHDNHYTTDEVEKIQY